METSKIAQLFHHRASGGAMLALAAVAAIICANSALSPLYDKLIETPVAISVGTFELKKPLLLWVNDGLMAIFFFLIGMEIKRELIIGELSKPSRVFFPVVAAIGGVLVPALIYVAINIDNPVGIHGWAIPMATDIVFALAVFLLITPELPKSLRMFLLTLAVLDDLIAIIVIAFFYSGNLSLISISFAGIAIAVLIMLNFFKVQHTALYIVVGMVLWLCVLKSGVHATLAGVILGFAIPLNATWNNKVSEKGSPLLRLEHSLKYWVVFGILPLFAFVNSGVSLAGFNIDTVLEPVTLGIILGLFLGKQIGIFGFAFLSDKLRIVRMPAGFTWLQLYGVSIVCGIGFTMSLFIGSLAFHEGELANAASDRLGIIIGSLLSAILGYIVLKSAAKHAVEGKVK